MILLYNKVNVLSAFNIFNVDFQLPRATCSTIYTIGGILLSYFRNGFSEVW